MQPWYEHCCQLAWDLHMTYTPLDRVARRLGTDEETLHCFRQLGWISSVEKNATEFLEGHQEYKARFILYLQNGLGLNSRQIGKVLSEQEPPYSAAKVDLVFSAEGTAKRVQ